MTPVTFDGCAGWLDVGSRSSGVVICAPFGREGMLTYRGCRILAASLHAEGFSVLRFDYPGTGDSSGDETDPDRLAAWQRGIADASAFLRQAACCTDVILVGLRLGGTLALRAAASDASIVAVCCLSPVVSGRSYTRELRLLTNGWHEANLLPAPPAAAAHLDVVGDRLHADTLRALSEIDLRKLERTAPDILLLDVADTVLSSRLADHLQRLGARLVRDDFAGATGFLQDPFAVQPPHQAFATVTSWCLGLPGRPGAALPGPRLPFAPRSDLLQLPDAMEQGLHFGPGGELYGVFCRPARQAGGTTAVLILNTGFGRRTGDGRMFVILARRLAGLGVCSFRIDVRGCGESGHVAQPYASQIVDDVVTASDVLADHGYDHVILVGVCSGAHAAFHAGLRDPRVAGMILVNLQKFIWQAGTPLLVENRRQRRPAAFYLKSVMRKNTWLRIARGRIAVGAIAAALIRRLLVMICNKAHLLLERHTGIPTRAGQVRRWLAGLGVRGVRINLLYSDGDPGLAELAMTIGSYPGSPEGLAHVLVEVVPHADHALLDHDARYRVIDRICRSIRDWAPEF